MPDKFHRNTGIGVKLFFKRKDTKSLREAPAHQIHAPGPPGPELRANVIDVSNPFRTQLARETQMKTREVRQNGERRPAALRFVHEPPHRADQGRQALQHLGDSYDGDFGIIRDDFNSSGAHLRTAHSENCNIQSLLQRGCEARGIHVSGSFAGGEKERYRWHVGWRRNQSLAGNTEASAERLDSTARCTSSSFYCN